MNLTLSEESNMPKQTTYGKKVNLSSKKFADAVKKLGQAHSFNYHCPRGDERDTSAEEAAVEKAFRDAVGIFPGQKFKLLYEFLRDFSSLWRPDFAMAFADKLDKLCP